MKVDGKYVIVPAAGAGLRFGGRTKKQFSLLGGTEILARTLLALSSCEELSGILVVTAAEDVPTVLALTEKHRIPKILSVIPGASTRQGSVLCGLRSLPKDCRLVAVHDGVRPFVTPALLSASFAAAEEYGACVAAVPVTDTVKRSADGFVRDTPPRAELFAAQTPQTFQKDLLLQAYLAAEAAGDLTLTDDAQAVERYGSTPVRLIPGSPENLKITSPADLLLAESLLERKAGREKH